MLRTLPHTMGSPQIIVPVTTKVLWKSYPLMVQLLSKKAGCVTWRHGGEKWAEQQVGAQNVALVFKESMDAVLATWNLSSKERLNVFTT